MQAVLDAVEGAIAKVLQDREQSPGWCDSGGLSSHDHGPLLIVTDDGMTQEWACPCCGNTRRGTLVAKVFPEGSVPSNRCCREEWYGHRPEVIEIDVRA